MFGKNVAATGDMGSVQMDVDHHDFGCLCRITCTFSKTIGADRTLVASWAFVDRDTDRLSRFFGWHTRQFFEVASGCFLGPVDKRVNFLGNSVGCFFEFKLAAGVFTFTNTLKADVVAATLYHRPRKVDAEMLLK